MEFLKQLGNLHRLILALDLGQKNLHQIFALAAKIAEGSDSATGVKKHPGFTHLANECRFSLPRYCADTRVSVAKRTSEIHLWFCCHIRTSQKLGQSQEPISSITRNRYDDK